MAATWYAVVDGAGNLISTGTVLADAATLTSRGYSTVTLTGDPAGQVWNATTKSFSAGPGKQTSISTWAFIQRFTAAEFAGIKASTDAQVQMFLMMLQSTPAINMNDPVVQNGLQYLVALNLLTAARAATIGVH